MTTQSAPFERGTESPQSGFARGDEPLKPMVPLRSVSYKLRGLPVRCAIYNHHPHRAHKEREALGVLPKEDGDLRKCS